MVVFSRVQAAWLGCCVVRGETVGDKKQDVCAGPERKGQREGERLEVRKLLPEVGNAFYLRV